MVHWRSFRWSDMLGCYQGSRPPAVSPATVWACVSLLETVFFFWLEFVSCSCILVIKLLVTRVSCMTDCVVSVVAWFMNWKGLGRTFCGLIEMLPSVLRWRIEEGNEKRKLRIASVPVERRTLPEYLGIYGVRAACRHSSTHVKVNIPVGPAEVEFCAIRNWVCIS
jgi:hypothetical protein